MIRAVLADDEPLARERLRTLIAGEPDIQLVAECGDGIAAIEGVDQHKPDLLFLDIQMPEVDGFEVLGALTTQPRAIIFVTAYDAFAVRAFDVAAVDYLLKPIDEARFRTAVERARSRVASNDAGASRAVEALVERLRREPQRAQRFVVRTGARVSLVRAEDVEWVEATGNYAKLFAAGKSHLVRETMKSIEARLDPAKFVRIHRSIIVQVDCIAMMEPYFHGEWVVRMRDGTRFTSSRTRSAQLRGLMR
jgi:two-component system LytT family response regulator